MKTYVIKLNHPVLVNNSTKETTHYDTVYGFIYSPAGNDRVKFFLSEGLKTYLGYLSAIHEWSSGEITDYSVDEDQNWITNSGEKHDTNDFWSNLIGEKCREKIDLRCSIYAMDVDVVELLKDKGMDESFVISESLMEKLVYLAKEQNRRERTIIVFNRPIWLPKNAFWEKENGFTHIYGIITDKASTSLLEDIKGYTGYLAMCEEHYLTGRTPSGYTTTDYTTWYRDEVAYNAKDEEIEEESFACKNKYNLKITAFAARNPSYTVAMGIRDDLIIDQELYEYLIGLIEQEKSGCREAGSGYPNTDSKTPYRVL